MAPLRRAAAALVCLALTLRPAPVVGAGDEASFSGSILLPDVRARLNLLLNQPFEFFDLSMPMVALGLLDVQDAASNDAVRQWLYNHIVATGTDSTEHGGTSAQTMIYLGLEDGRSVGYWKTISVAST